MAASRAPAWRLNLVLVILVCLFSGCCCLLWARRVAWHPVATLPGSLPSERSRVPYTFDSPNGVLTFADTGERYVLPVDYRGKMEIGTFPPSRASFVFNTSEVDGVQGDRCWNMAAHCEVPLPKNVADRWRLSPSGLRVLVTDVRSDQSVGYQVLGLDGRVLHERTLPELPNDARATYSAEGKYLIVTFSDETRVNPTRIYDMASESSWPFADRFAGLSEEGVVWLRDAALNINRNGPQTLRTVRLTTGQELWRVELPAGEITLQELGRNKLLVSVWGSMASAGVYDAIDGRKLFDIDLSGAPAEIHEAGPHVFLLTDKNVWSVETGKKVTLEGPIYSIEFFEDGRRALLDVKCGWPGRIVDLETGKILHLFAPPPPRVVGGNVMLAGDKVLHWDRDMNSSTLPPVEVWERRYPEGWKGHLLRPELLGAVFLGAAVVVLWLNRPRHEHLPQASQG